MSPAGALPLRVRVGLASGMALPRSLFLAAALAGATGCATGGAFVCPARGGAAWHEVTSEHFVVRGDVGEARVKDFARELEIVRATLLNAFFGPDLHAPGRLEVVVFRNLDELLPFTRDPRAAGMMHESGLGERRILVGTHAELEGKRLAAHELVHVLAQHAVHQQPLWFAEGLAMYLEGVGERGLGGGRKVGSPPIPDPEFIRLAAGAPARGAIAWQRARWPLETLYAKSFLLVHYLITQRSEPFRTYRSRLAAMQDPFEAWNATFPEWRLDEPGATEKLDPILEKHAGVYLSRTTLKAAQIEPALASRVMAPAEVHALRLDLPHRFTQEVLRAEVHEALAEDPGLVRALEHQADESPELAVELARRAVAAHPEDPRAWELMGRALDESDGREREAMFRKAIAAAPDRVRAHVVLAVELERQGRFADAQVASARALEVAPWSPVALLVGGVSLARLGHCDEARSLARRASGLARHAGAEGQSGAAHGTAAVEELCGAAGRARGR